MAKYIDADLLRKEIDSVEEEARKVRVSGTDKEAIGADGKVKLCLELKAIINSLQQEEPEKPIPNDLEEAAEEESTWAFPEPTAQGYAKRLFFKPGFKRGAKWQKEQMLKKAVEGHITNAGGEFGYDVATFRFDENHTYTVLLPHEEGRKHGDKVSIIILPTEDKQ
ncbi:MAG: hypothetical protein J6Y37_08570 [Paludibacteraceae bacterium]|nr:hypothetical protein [Paludibacteraceae bacterium]